MSLFMAISLTILITILQTAHIQCNDNLRVAYQWKEIDFEYRSARDREEAISSKTFIPGNKPSHYMSLHISLFPMSLLRHNHFARYDKFNIVWNIGLF